MYNYDEYVRNISFIQKLNFYWEYFTVLVYVVAVFYLARVPKKMRYYALLLFHTVFWAASLDFFLNSAGIILYFPLSAIGFEGIFENIVSSEIVAELIVFTVHMAVLSLSLLYTYRLRLILMWSEVSWKFFLNSMLRVNCFSQFCLGFGIFYVLDRWLSDDEDDRKAMAVGFCNLPPSYHTNATMIVNVFPGLVGDKVLLFGGITFIAYSAISIVLVLPYITQTVLRRTSSKMSLMTLKMHKAVLKALFCQTVVHVFCFLIPITCFQFIYTNMVSSNPAINEILLQSVKLHGTTVTCVMLVVHPMIFRIIKADFASLTKSKRSVVAVMIFVPTPTPDRTTSSS